MEIVLPYLFGVLVAAVLLKALWPKRRQRTRYSAHSVAREVEERLYDEQPVREQTDAIGLDGDVWEWPDLDDWDEVDPTRRRRDAA